MRRTRMVLATSGLVLALVNSGPAPPAVAYPAPQPLVPLTASGLGARFSATQETVRVALSVARQADDGRRATTLAALEGRQLLEFDGRGNGRVVEVLGDLVAAERIAVIVPGSHTTIDTFDRNRGPGGGAQALIEAIAAIDPSVPVAVVAWLGYDTPQGASYRAATDGLAQAGADALRMTVESIVDLNPGAAISLLCHSYGSVVCAYAAPGLPVADLAVYGSPGMAAGSVDELDTAARVWAGRAGGDWIRFVPGVRVAGVGFGADPAAPEFGALPFPAGTGGHGDYHLRGGESLDSLARIVLGELATSPGVPHV